MSSSFKTYTNKYGNLALEKYTGKGREVVIPDGIEYIDPRAFEGHTEIEEVYIPTTVKIIDSYAFSGCTALKEIVIPRSVYLIGDHAFAGCRSLSLVKIGYTYVNLGHSLFSSAARSFKISFYGASRNFEDKIKVQVSKVTESEGDYHHPSSSHFRVYDIITYGELFGSENDGDFTCEVYCEWDQKTLNYTAKKENLWQEIK